MRPDAVLLASWSSRSWRVGLSIAVDKLFLLSVVGKGREARRAVAALLGPSGVLLDADPPARIHTRADRTAWMEVAARRRVVWIGRIPHLDAHVAGELLARAGTVSSSVRVYGCCGSETTASVSTSTMRPRYMTASIADVAHGRQVVRDEDHRDAQALLQITHEVEDRALHRDVERRGDLVRDQHLGPSGEGARDGDSLPLPSRQALGG